MDKPAATTTGVKKVTCTCGSVVMSHDQKEVAVLVVAHVRDKHRQEFTIDDGNGLMKDV